MSVVYFIKPIGMEGPVKIGCSYSPDGRRETLEYWSPFALEIVAEIEGDFELERRFHAQFIDNYLRHEWFGWSRPLQATIDAIRNGSFDIAALPAAETLPRRKRDLSYITPGWRYATSVMARLRSLRRRGVSWRDISDECLSRTQIESLCGDELEAAKVHCEAALVRLAALTSSAPTKPTPQSAVAAA